MNDSRSMRACGAAALLLFALSGTALGDAFDGTVDPGASSATITGSASIENTGTLIGDYDATSNPSGTSTIPGFFGGSGNNPINIDLDGSIDTDLSTNPTGGMSIDIDFDELSIDITGLIIDVLGGESGTAQPTVSMLFETFHTSNPGFIYPGGIPFEIPIGDGSSMDSAVITQTSDGLGVMTATEDPDIFDFTIGVPAELALSFTLGIDGVDTPAFDAVPVIMPMTGTVQRLGSGDVVLTMIVDPVTSSDSFPLEGVTTPEIPFELPTLSSETAGVLITLTPDTLGVNVTYAWSLTVNATAASCAADFTDDGVLDIFDVLDFISAFNASDPSADFTNDSVFDIFDVLAFIEAFNAGCP